MLPGWAPNLHPLVVHFPIVLVLAGVVADWLDTAFEGPDWIGPMATCLYAIGSAAAALAYWTGARAAAAVLVPGPAHPMIESHRNWALATALFVGVVALAQMAMHWTRTRGNRRLRLVLGVAGLVAVALVVETADRGGRLVYEQGVGVVHRLGAPGAR